MKRIAIAAAAVLVMAGAAQAQQRTPASPWYGELGYSFLQLKESSTGFDATPQALRGIVGYNFHPYFAGEAMLSIGTNSDSDLGVDAKVKHAYGLFLKPKYDFNNFEVFGRLGWARTKVDFSVPGFSASGSDSDFAYGVGVNYSFNPKMYVGADWMQLLDKDTTKIRGWTISVGYRF
jgi:outer membrane autotransporter protein